MFLTCSVVLFPVAVTFLVTWWFFEFVDGFFSPIYAKLGIDILGKTCVLMVFWLWFLLLNYHMLLRAPHHYQDDRKLVFVLEKMVKKT